MQMDNLQCFWVTLERIWSNFSIYIWANLRSIFVNFNIFRQTSEAFGLLFIVFQQISLDKIKILHLLKDPLTLRLLINL